MVYTDITDRDIAAYQQARQDTNAAHKTINNEVGTLRAILRRHRLWAQLAPDVHMLPVRTDVGVALTPEQEEKLAKACAASRSRSLLPAFTLGIHTGLRNGELRFLRWRRVDLLTKVITVGKAKPGFSFYLSRMAPLYTRPPPRARISVRRTIVQLQRLSLSPR